MTKVNVRSKQRRDDAIDFDTPHDGDTPSEQVVRAASAQEKAVDSDGRVIMVRKLSPLMRMKLFAAVGPELSKNQQYLGTAMLAAAATSIDGDPVMFPQTRLQLEALVERLGDPGLEAIGYAMVKLMNISIDAEGNVYNADGDVVVAAKN